MQGHRRAIILTAMPRENYPTLRDMALQTSETMVLEARDSATHHVHQNQLGAARRTTHRPYSDQQSSIERLSVGDTICPFQCCDAVPHYGSIARRPTAHRAERNESDIARGKQSTQSPVTTAS
jgi:hypothetical protein